MKPSLCTEKDHYFIKLTNVTVKSFMREAKITCDFRKVLENYVSRKTKINLRFYNNVVTLNSSEQTYVHFCKYTRTLYLLLDGLLSLGARQSLIIRVS